MHSLASLDSATNHPPTAFFQTMATLQLGLLIALLFQVRPFDHEASRYEFPRSITWVGLAAVVAGVGGLVASLHAIRHGGSYVTLIEARLALCLTVPLVFGPTVWALVRRNVTHPVWGPLLEAAAVLALVAIVSFGI